MSPNDKYGIPSEDLDAIVQMIRKKRGTSTIIPTPETSTEIPTESIDEFVNKRRAKNYISSFEPRADKLELLLPKEVEGLTIDGELAKHYTQALHAMGYTQINKDSYVIGKEGFCKAVAEEIGYDYLNGHMIIVTPKQKDYLCHRTNYSFMEDLIDKVFETQVNLIETLYPHEALIGEIENPLMNKGLESFIFGELTDEQRFTLTVALETPMKAVKRIADLKKKIERFDEEPEALIKDLPYVNACLKEAKELSAVYGDLFNIMIPNSNKTSNKLKSMRIVTPEAEVYMFSNDKPLYIYFSKTDKLNDSVVTKDYIVINGNDVPKLLNTLFEINYIKYSTEVISGMIKKLTDEYERSTKTHSLNKALTKALEGKKRELPEGINALQQLLNGFNESDCKDTYFNNLDPEIKYTICFPNLNNLTFAELLKRADPNKMRNLYLQHNTKFREQLTSSTPEEKEKILVELLDNLNFKHQYNLEDNLWMNKTPEIKAILDKLGVNWKTVE